MRKIALAALLATTTLTSPVHAQGVLNSLSGPLVFDSHGQQVGQLLGNGTILRQFKDQVFRQLNVDGHGFNAYVQFYYASSNCTGPRFFNAFPYLPAVAWYEGTASPGSVGNTLWGYSPTATPQAITYHSYWLENPSPVDPSEDSFTGCVPTGPTSLEATPAINLGASTFTPPFCVGTALQGCRGQ